jgi:hypothetical protein
MFPGTPQKPQQYGNMVNGYMTPPITPDGEYFATAGGNEIKAYHQAPRCPVTPTSNHTQYPPQQHYQSYHHDMIMH